MIIMPLRLIAMMSTSLKLMRKENIARILGRCEGVGGAS